MREDDTSEVGAPEAPFTANTSRASRPADRPIADERSELLTVGFRTAARTELTTFPVIVPPSPP